MKIHRYPLNFIFASLVSLFVSSSFGASYPASYQFDSTPLSTLSQFKQRIEVHHPELTNNYQNIESVQWRESFYPALRIESEGVRAGYLFKQKLTYIELHTGLWRMVWVDSQRCERGLSLENGIWVEGWKCDDLEAPMSGAFSDIYILSDDVNIAQLSINWGKEIIPYSTPVENNEGETVLHSLGDLQKLMLNRGATWSLQTSTWTGIEGIPEPAQPALSIQVTGSINETRRFDQTFLYLIKEGQLKLKSVDGGICGFNQTLGGELCEDIASPTQWTPFPFVMLNTMEESNPFVINESDNNTIESQPVTTQLQCGNLAANLELILRVHFEQSVFYLQDINTYRQAFARLPQVADPLNVALTEQDTLFFKNAVLEPFIQDETIHLFMEEVNKGEMGDCSLLTPFIDQLQERLSQEKMILEEVLNTLVEQLFIQEQTSLQISQLSQRHQYWWDQVELKQNELKKDFNNQQALDIASEQLLGYLTKSAQNLSDYEKTLTMAFANQDAYSRLIELNPTHLQNNDGLFFGLSTLRGFSGSHYIAQIHPKVAHDYGLKVGDEILNIQGELAKNLTSEDLDAFLIDTSLNLDMIFKTASGEVRHQLKAEPLSYAELFYSIESLPVNSGRVLKINIESFPSGLADKLYQELQSELAQGNVKGFILNLQDNQGGQLDEANKIVSFFARERNIGFFHRGARGTGQASPYTAQSDYFLSDTLPLVIQTNENSASSAELVASPLQGLGRGLIIGGATHGKFIAQEQVSIQLSDQSFYGLVLSSHEFFNPQGISFNGIGLSPDIEIFARTTPLFVDGNRPAQDYQLRPEDEFNPYPESLTEFAPMIKTQAEANPQALDIDQLSIQVILSILDNL